MFKKEQGDTRQTAVYSRLHLLLAGPVPSAIGGHEKQDGCLDQKHLTGVKLMAVPVIRAVRSPKHDPTLVQVDRIKFEEVHCKFHVEDFTLLHIFQ